MKINIAVAFCKNYGIGFKNSLPWTHLKCDLTLFSKRTTGSGNNAVLMGKNTWFSIPENRRPLKNRTNIIISGSNDFKSTTNDEKRDNQYVFSSIESAVSFCESEKYDELWIIGGSQIYDEFFKTYCDKINRVYITYVCGDYECDAFINFPVSNYCVEEEIFNCAEKCYYLKCIHTNHEDNNYKNNKNYKINNNLQTILNSSRYL